MAIENEELTTIRDQAAHWWAVLEEGKASAAEKREFANWARQGSERIEAMLRVARISKGLTNVRIPDVPIDVLIREAISAPGETVIPLRREVKPAPRQRRRVVVRFAAGLAAAVLLASGVSWFTLRGAERFETRLGEQRSVMLADGSRITLNTASSVAIKLGADRRVVDLVAGEALFEVAHDAKRPFEVHVGKVVLQAVGTQFDVDRRVTRTTVTVTDGRVAVMAAEARTTHFPVLSSGERVVIVGDVPGEIEKGIDRVEATAWTQGQLIFRQRPLGEIAEEISRYNNARVDIRSPSLRARKVTGTFRTDGVASFVALLSGIPGVQVADDGAGGYLVTADDAATSE